MEDIRYVAQPEFNSVSLNQKVDRGDKLDAWKSDSMYLRRKAKHWNHTLPQAEFTYSSEVHNVMGISPFALVYMEVPKHAIDFILLSKEHWASVVAERIARKVQDVQSKVKKKLEKTNAKYKVVVDKRHIPRLKKMIW